ncbi:MAG: DEAD/DEAH box helicase [Bacteroides sp.]|nr:DEAD/DEAH box helicase [Bacteroides sp.]
MAKFSCGDTVINILTSEKGIVSEVLKGGRGRQMYRVRFEKSEETCLEKVLDSYFDIENPFERARKGIFGNRDQFVLVNTTYKINNSNNNTISSLKASKTIFKAYQFKPLLKFLNSPTRRILIADEVGLGKTIEAGHIMLELKARDEFKSALIISPNSLKVKWQAELQEKFGLDFKIYESLNDAVEDLKAHPQTARGILNYEKIRARKKEDGNQKKKEKVEDEPTNALIDYLNTGHRKYSLILCDEAHKMRNNVTQTFRGMSKILDYADAVVFLTATPIMLGEGDLYNLLRLLDPTEFDNHEVFKNLINANKPFIKALALINAHKPLSEIKELLTKSEIEQVQEIGDDYSFTERIPVEKRYEGISLYDKIIRELDEEDSMSLRARLQDDIAAMSTINNVFSRTRKREVSTEERQQTERSAHKIVVNLTDAEREVYNQVIEDYLESKGGVECDAYGEETIPKGAILGLIQKKRMVASSVNAYSLYTHNNCNVDDFCRDVASINYLPDSKISCLEQIFKGVKSADGKKVIIFTVFKFTARYLTIRLRKMGYKVFSIHGDISIKEREEVIQQFRSCQEFCVLISTEVGSEGLDMQFCSHLVNYDLPWNPMVVEQRIGRIDRFGQKAAQVHIYNLIVSNSIQELIYDRLLERVGVFRGAIGELEMILEEDDLKEQLSRLENDIYGMQLSKEAQEKKVLDLAKAVETHKIQLEQVEEGMTNALSNDIYFQNEISKIRDRKLYVTEDELKNYVNMLIAEKLKTCSFEAVDKSEYALSVPKSTPTVLNGFLTENQPIGVDFDNLFRIYRQRLLEDFKDNGRRILTFDQAYAFDNKNVDFVNIYNPIIVASAVYFKRAIDDIGKTFKLAYTLSDCSLLSKGLYFLAVYVVSTNRQVMGKQVSSDVLVPVLYNVEEDRTIQDEDINMSVFGSIQDNAEFYDDSLEVKDVSHESYSNMEADFTEYITDYMFRKKEDITIKDESQKQLRLRQNEEYYSARLQRVKKSIENLEFRRDHSLDKAEAQKAISDIRLAEYRYKMLEDGKAAALERVNAIQPASLSYSLISLSKLMIK